MKQPKNEIKPYFLDQKEVGSDKDEYWIELDGGRGRGSYVEISTGLSRKAACKAAIRRLNRLIRDVEKLAAKEG